MALADLRGMQCEFGGIVSELMEGQWSMVMSYANVTNSDISVKQFSFQNREHPLFSMHEINLN